MANRLEPLNLADFTGGLNLRRNQFQLAENESPEMLNIEVDPRGGIYSRLGWERRDTAPIVTSNWDPRAAYIHLHSDGNYVGYIANAGNDTLYSATGSDAYAAVTGPVTTADPHAADFAAWGDTMYVVCGRSRNTYKRVGTAAMSSVTIAQAATWHNDYTAPSGGTFPSAEFAETHSGYMFVANTYEDATNLRNRLRWSHPNLPEDWASADFIDINAGGTRITGIMSFQDHLLIFKDQSVWALYGYDSDSWQLVQKSTRVGPPSPQAFTRSEDTVFFYTQRGNPGIYGYAGDEPVEISEKLRLAFDAITSPDKVFMGWVLHRLWVSVPWDYTGPESEATSVFAFDPTVGDGAWVMHQSPDGCPGPYFDGITPLSYPLAAMRSPSCIVNLEKIEDGHDNFREPDLLYTVGNEPIVTVTASDNIQLLPVQRVPDSYYRTRWIDAGWPTRKKSWRRPDLVVREFGSEYVLRINAYRDHFESAPYRTQTIEVDSLGGAAVWGQFQWGDGTFWGQGEKSARIERGSALGIARAVQLLIFGPSTQPNRWGIDAVVMKYVARRFR